jgi:hypothetical protein
MSRASRPTSKSRNRSQTSKLMKTNELWPPLGQVRSPSDTLAGLGARKRRIETPRIHGLCPTALGVTDQ